MTHLRSLSLRPTTGQQNVFPFNIPAIRSLETLEFPSPVTFFVGENGSGKSTMLEAIAAEVGSVTVGSESVSTDQSLAHVRTLSDQLKLVWNQRTRKGFFMRSEDFFGYARRMTQVKAELQDDLRRVDDEYAEKSELSRNLARMSYSRELHALNDFYGEGLDAQSHGESYFKLFQARFKAGGLYLLDEPEAPLSPMRQLSFLAMLKQMIDQNAQFIIATHSPIILAYPGATIYNFDGGKIIPAAYDTLEHVVLTRDFLTNPSIFLRHLIE